MSDIKERSGRESIFTGCTMCIYGLYVFNIGLRAGKGFTPLNIRVVV